MRIIFFQNCVSPHQMPYIKHLQEFDDVSKVYVVSPVSDLNERKSLGWDMEDATSGDVEIIISPSDEDVEALMKRNLEEDKKTWCMFSGINAFADVARWFRLSLKFQVRRGIITEPPYIYDHPLWQHALRFAIQDYRYVKYIDKLFLMGEDYISYYTFWSKKWDVIPFVYCTEWIKRELPVLQCEKLKVLYVGALTDRKNVSILLSAISKLSSEEQKHIECGIVGDGDKTEDLKHLVLSENFKAEVQFYGVKGMEEIPPLMQQYDILVLPSKHDGWGAVVNEALTLGLYVVCSDACGAKYLLKDKQLGNVFKNKCEVELKNILSNCLSNKEEIRKGTYERITWAKENISGRAVAKYFLNHLI